MRYLLTALFLLLPATTGFTTPAAQTGLTGLFNQVQALNIQQHGYTLAAPLTKAQEETAKTNRLDPGSPKLIKFADNGLHVVADQQTRRVLVMYEKQEKVTQKQVQTLVGDLFLTFEDPTVSAHDTVVYWAWGKKGKFTADQFDLAKEKKKPLTIIATVKLNSEIKIMDKAEADKTGDAYYIISSDPILRFFQ